MIIKKLGEINSQYNEWKKGIKANIKMKKKTELKKYEKYKKEMD